MNCPACHQPLAEKEIITSDNQKALVYECFNCGGHFTPPLIANLIPSVTAQDLDSIAPKNTYLQSSSVDCPICHASMVAITDTAVPRGVTIYACPENHGNFFPLHQLFAFKRAQKAKLEYHELWGIPIKSIFTILLPVMAIFTAITAIPFTLRQLRESQESRVKASEVITTPLITPINSSQVVVSFSSRNPAITRLRLVSAEVNITYDVSVKAQTNHVISLPNLKTGITYSYYLLVDGKEYGPYYFSPPPP